MITALFSAAPNMWAAYEAPLHAQFERAGLSVDLICAPAADMDPAQVDYLIYAPGGSVEDFTPFTRAKAVLSLWAGVEAIAPNPSLTQPLARMVDPSLAEGMREWVAGHVLRHHLGMDAQIHGQNGQWIPVVPPLAKQRPVSILGLGELGQACAQSLIGLGFPVTGWSRHPKDLPGMRCLSGEDGFRETLSTAQILVLLLPLTAATENLINTDALAMLPEGAVILNPGRGGLIDDHALLGALDDGRVGHATLDVFRCEPLPADHAYWQHPKVTVTPHIASSTRPETASGVIAENIQRAEAGRPLLHLVDRSAGY
ncbi:MAG: glyoxylate/hydroxypyruvate reductase A [Mangrovicoccus sp.]|nr:glyoxylate/hydroxypyruvate reductase A [Mangrovicoccus sp.]